MSNAVVHPFGNNGHALFGQSLCNANQSGYLRDTPAEQQSSSADDFGNVAYYFNYEQVYPPQTRGLATNFTRGFNNHPGCSREQFMNAPDQIEPLDNYVVTFALDPVVPWPTAGPVAMSLAPLPHYQVCPQEQLFNNYMVPYAPVPEASTPIRVPDALALAPLPARTTTSNPGFSCSRYGCTKSFKRDADRIRHENAIHLGQKHFCPIIGCPKNTGNGYSRADKVKEHMGKKH